MSNGYDDIDGLLPDNIMEVVAGSSSDFVTNGIQEDLRIAQDALEIAEAEIAVVMAGCLSEAMECDQACQQCIRGILERDLENVNDVLGRVTDRIERDIQQSLSQGRLAAMGLGVPITDLTLVNGIPITTNGVSNFIPDVPVETVNVQICPEQTLPVVTPENRILCVAEDTPPAVIDAIETGGPKPPGTPPLVTVPPIQQPVTPTKPITTDNPFNIPMDWKICIQDFDQQRIITWGEYLNTHQVSGISFDLQSTYQHALNGGSLFANQGLDGHVGFTNAGTCGVSSPPVCPPCTTGTGPTQQPVSSGNLTSTSHLFCDPSNFEHASPDLTLTGSTSVLLSPTAGSPVPTNPHTESSGLTAFFRGFIDSFGQGTNDIAKGIFESITTGFIQLVSPTVEAGPCTSSEFKSLAIVNALPSLLSRFFQLVPPNITVPNEYTLNYICPYLIPSQAEINGMVIRGYINESQWAAATRANGFCPEWQEIVKKLGQQIPTVDQAAMMERRKLIDYEQYKKFAEQNGVLEDSDKALFYSMTEFVPGPSDLVRFMVRDAFDDSLETNKLADQELPAKFTERAKQWAESQGIPEDVFKFFWRAHYDYPSPTQLYSMLHRLRKPTPLPNNQGTAAPVDVALIRKVLQINDLSPEFVDRMIALSFNPLTRVDSRRAYEIGELSEEELREAYLDLGYSPENADRLLKFSRATSGPIRAKRLGNASMTEVLNWYRDNLIPKDQAIELLKSSGVPEDYVSKYIQTADLRRVTASRKLAIAAIRKRFNHGELSTPELVDLLSRANVSPDRIGELINNWTLVRDAKYKAPTVGMLCDWWSRGFITMDEFTRRCTNLGYSLVDAERIVANCQGKTVEKKAAEADKLAKEAERRQRQIESDRRRVIRDQKTLEKEIQKALAEAAPCKPPPKPTCDIGSNGKQGD